MAIISEEICQANLIPAYIDGELDTDSQACFESHLESCEDCRVELRAHRLFICELDAALSHKLEVDVPAGFSRLVTARATSDMSGVRSASENRKALGICAILAIVGFALVGATSRLSAISSSRRLVSTVFGLLSFLWTTLYDAFASVAVILRVVSHKFVAETRSVGLLLVILALAVVLLSRLISHYHRTSATE
jgi:hypothetical protein